MTQTNPKEQMSQVGAVVKIKWTEDEIGDSGWKPGWYNAYVQAYSEEDDIIDVTYPTEPNCTYSIQLDTYIKDKKL